MGPPDGRRPRLFEKICLEGFQSGLSWLTILRKRENFRAAFAGFDIDARRRASARTTSTRLLGDAGIVRHRGKIESTINNARRACELARRGRLARRMLLALRAAAASRPRRSTARRCRRSAKTPESIALSKDLKRRGWSFVGPTTVYAFMQAMGLVNDHLEGCACRAEVERERKASAPLRSDGH